MSRTPAASKSNRLDVTIGPGVASIRSDRTKLRQILLNLIGNACKFTANGHVVVSAKRVQGPTGDLFECEVTDSGIGMTPEHIARRLARLLGGGVTVVSAAGRGSVFTLRVPATLDSSSPLGAEGVAGPPPREPVGLPTQ